MTPVEEQLTLKKVSGIYAAVLTPRLPDDNVDAAALDHLITFLLSKGISAFAMNGATGEFCLTKPRHLHVILSTVQKASQGKAKILCGVGAPGSALAIELAAIAQQEGAEGLLLPMPCFFPYQQEDLDLYCREVAGGTKLPVMLYNLPQFTSGLSKETVRALITEVPNIIGIKDSSGDPANLAAYRAAVPGWSVLVGSASHLRRAVELKCEGGILGVACFWAAACLALKRAVEQGNGPEAERLQGQIATVDREIVGKLGPAGIKAAMDLVGLIGGAPRPPLVPLSSAARDRVAALVGA